MASQASIAIVGGGPSGLCLGALLHRQNIPFTVYDLRDKPTAETVAKPSGMLDLHQESGLAAVRACGLEHQFTPLTLDCAEGTKVMKRDLTVTHESHSDDGDRPEIARNALTHLFALAVPAESVHWNHKVTGVSRTAGGRIALDLGENGVKEHDFVVGADGAWSKVRPLLTAVKPHYGGVYYATLHILDATRRYPELASVLGPGMTFLLGENSGLITHRGVNQSIAMYVVVADEDEHALGAKTASFTPDQLTEFLVSDPALYGTFGEKAKTLIATACEQDPELSAGAPANLKAMYNLPVGHSWDSQKGVTLVGDAAHLMMPWAGEGANLALWDSVTLSEALVAAWKESSAAATFQEIAQPHVARFEKIMFERSTEPAEMTAQNSNMLFGGDGAETMGKIFDGMMAQDPGQA